MRKAGFLTTRLKWRILHERLCINPLVTNGFSHSYHLDEFTSIFRGIRGNFQFSFHFSMNLVPANRMAPDGTPRFAKSHLGLFCLPMSQKRTQCVYGLKHCSNELKEHLTVFPYIATLNTPKFNTNFKAIDNNQNVHFFCIT